MKKIILLMILSIVSIPSSYAARGLGMGVIIGDPTGLSFKNFFQGTKAIDGAIAYNSDEVILYSDYLMHFPGTFGKQNDFVAALTPYAGIGPVLAFDDDDDHNHHNHDRDLVDNDEDDEFALGVRIPFGIEWTAKSAPVGISLEIVPGVVVISETDAFMQGGLALRYYFR